MMRLPKIDIAADRYQENYIKKTLMVKDVSVERPSKAGPAGHPLQPRLDPWDGLK
jgi:hypothetical protein